MTSPSGPSPSTDTADAGHALDATDAGGDPDATDAALRAARRRRVLAAMEATGLDALVLGRRDDLAYATGARTLWTAGTRPFGAACVLVRATGEAHLLSTWDAGVPPEIPFEHLYGVTWNPAVMAEALGAIPGFVAARRIGVDAWSVGFARALGRLAPQAELVPADDVLRSVRATKLPAEVERIATAVGVARAGLDAAAGVLGAGGDAAAARSAALRALAERDAVVPTTGVAVEPACAGDARTRVDIGVLAAGYEGGIGRTIGPSGEEQGDDTPAAGAQRRIAAACRPGALGADVAAAARDAGVDRWRVRGSGMGVEPPVVTDDLGAAVVLGAAMVLSVEVAVAGDHRRDLVLLTDGPPRTL